MKYPVWLLSFKNILIIPALSIVLLSTGSALAAQLKLTWADNSTNEEGFKIERKIGTTGTFTQVASVAVNTTSYTDSNVTTGTTYCYRTSAFNTAGSSAPSGEACGAPTTSTASTFTLKVSKTGTGSGTASSNPAGISCGADCSESYVSGTAVKLTATPTTGSTFAGWSGDADCTDGSVTMSAAKTCTATFTLSSTPPLTLTVTKAGNGSGAVSSAPSGISCGADCSESYVGGTAVKLTATPTTGSTFAGWSGDADCTDGSVTMSAAKTCTATFTSQQTSTLTITKSGSGTVSATGINCGTDCSESYVSGTAVKLTATPTTGSTFAGWSGDADCTDGSVTMSAAKTCTATFKSILAVQIGVYRPSRSQWILDINANGTFDGCTNDACPSFGTSTDLPVVGDWTGSGQIQLGVFDPTLSLWELDRNANDKWEDCVVDICRGPFGLGVIVHPVAGYWKGKGATSPAMSIGAFRASSVGLWYFDLDNNGRFDINTDRRSGPFGSPTDLPIVGNWTGSGLTGIGTFTPETGIWHLDRNSNGAFDGCDVDFCLGPFGKAGNRPVAADWNGSGTDKIGIFEPATGLWKLDINGNGLFDGCKIDSCLGPFGTTGDLPVVGKW